MRIKVHTIRFKAGMLYALILAVILVVFGGVTYYHLKRLLYSDLDQELRMKAREILAILNAYEQINRPQSQPFQMLLDVLAQGGVIQDQKVVIDDLWKAKLEVLRIKNDYLNIVNAQGRTILYSDNFDEEIATIFQRQFPPHFGQIVFRSLHEGAIHLRAVNMPVAYQGHPLVLQIATPLNKTLALLRSMLFWLGILTVGILFLSGFIGSFFAEKALLPVRETTRAAKHIVEHKDLSVRLPERVADVEMRDLVRAFNHMISQLETSFQHISEFSSHVAHELKTPLAIVKGELELALNKERSSQEYQRVLRECLEEIDRMIRIIKDILLLAKIDYKPEIFEFERLSLTDFLREIHEQSRVLAAEKRISVQMELPKEEVFIRADKVHLRRLFLNLITNAVQYTPENGRVFIRVRRDDPEVHVAIEDTGVGIHPDHQEKIFDKFFRAPKTKADREGGSGLGLNIAQSIARVHQGHIAVESVLEKGSIFTVTLPVWDDLASDLQR